MHVWEERGVLRERDISKVAANPGEGFARKAENGSGQ
jgi:hypothetical protein